MAGKIFINYRREDARADARNIRDRLAGAFGASCVFMDVDNLQPGQRFDRELAKALAQCNVFLAVIGPRWQAVLEERAQMGVHDYVREEIAAALANGMAVIPVPIERTPMPTADSLPPDMRALVMHQKHGVEHERFGRDVEELIAAVRAILKTRRRGGVQSTWLRATARVLGLIVGAYVAAQLLFLIVGAFTFAVHRYSRTEPAPPPPVAEPASPVKEAAGSPRSTTRAASIPN